MNGVRPLALILALATGCVALAVMWPHLTSERATLPAEVVEGAVLQQDCVDDVSVTISSQWGVIERTTYTLKDPPDYKAGDDIGIYYNVTNSSCRNVTVTVELKGSVSETTIHNADTTDNMACLEGCTIKAGDTLNGNVGWDLSKHPNATGERVVATITISAPSDFSDTDTSNNSATSTQAINIVNEQPDPAPDIAVKSVTPSVSEAVVGDSVVFTVTVQNEGDADAEASATVTLDHGEGTDELDSTTASALAAGDEETVTLTWNTAGAESGEHSLRALAQTEGDGDADNDSAGVTVTLIQRSVDVAVKSVTASATEAVVGDTVDFTVTLENGGNVPAVTPAVSLFDADGPEDAEPLETVTADTMAVDGTKPVTISWNTDGAEAGTYSLRVVAAVADDADSSNDSATASLTLHDPVDVALSLTSDLATSVVKGSTVSVPFTVTNSGEKDAGEISIGLYVTKDGEDQHDTPTDTATVPALAAAKSEPGTLTWDTSVAAVGDYALELVAETIGDTDESNDSTTAYIELRNWLVLKGVTPESAEAVIGDTISFTAQVENVGTDELTGVTVGLYESGIDRVLDDVDFASIADGDTGDATIEWDTTGRDVGKVELFVIAGADGQAPDRDDTQSVNVTVRNPIAVSSVSPASNDNVAGLPVTINIQVLNESDLEVTNVAVDLFVGDSEEAANSAMIASIAAGKTAAASLTWDAADVEPVKHELKIVASVAGYGSDENDAASMPVTLRAPVVDAVLTGVSINRNVAAIGQTLEIVATVANRGEAPVVMPVALYLVAEKQGTTAAARETSPSIGPGASAEMTLQWDSTGETAGRHKLKVAAELSEDTTDDDNEKLIEIELFHSAFEGDDAPESCLEDVRATVDSVRDIGGQQRSPPDYLVGENLRVVYTVYNYSCETDVAAAIAMTGPEGHAISDTAMLCFSNCVVPFGGRVEGEVAWIIPTLPALSDQPITATVTVLSPNDFADDNEANNLAESTHQVNIVHPDDILLDLGEEKGNKVSARRPMTGPEFGAVDVRLVSTNPVQTTLPFAEATVEVAVEVANDGLTTEPAAVRFVLAPDDGADPLELHRHPMVIPIGQPRTETIDVPLDGVLPGVHTIEALLSAAVDLSTENNAATFDITRMAPLVNVEMEDVAVSPDMLILGDDATVSLEIRNESEIALPLSLELYVDDDAEPIGTKTIYELAPGRQSEQVIAWRVPASARMLGKHTLRLMASSEEFGTVASTDKDITFRIDAEILRINALPTDTAMRGEEVAIEVEVQNNGPATVNVPVTLRFPSATKNPETRSPAVLAGSTDKAGFTWKTRNYSVGDHMLTATVPEQHNIASCQTSMELPFRVSPLAVKAEIVNVSVYPEKPSVGEPVSIAVTVRNKGPVATRIPITLRFPPGGRQPDSKKPHLGPGEPGTVVFEWRTGNYRPGTHSFLTEVAAMNSPQRHFTVDLLPTIENVAIVDMGTYPADTAMVGQPVEVWIDVRNDGPLAIRVPVRLTFPSDDKKPEQDSERIEPGEIARYSFTWRTRNYEPGIHALQAALLLRYNATLGRTTDEISFALTPLIIKATIEEVTVNPKEPRVGEPVTITVIVRNNSRIAANIPVTLHFPPVGKQPEYRSPRVNVGAIGEAVFTWHTGHYEPVMHDFRAEAASEPPSTHEFTIELLPPIVHVAIIGMGSDPSETAVKGQAVKIWVNVINNGPLALDVPVQLLFPSSDKRPERESTRIEPGQTARVAFTWKTSNYDPGIHALTATLLAEYNTTELNTSATIQIRLISHRLIASIVDISLSPDSPVVGEPVDITVTVRNDGLVTSSIPVTLYFPSADKQPETKRPRVTPGVVGTASFTWRTGRYEPGDHVFRVQIPGVAGAVRTFEIELRPPEVDFAVADLQTPGPLHPIVKGDWVEITVAVQNRGPYAGRGTVYLLDAADLDTMYEQSASLEPGESRSVEFTWKTLRYAVGGYELLARVEAEYDTDSDNNESDRVPVHLLTDRDITVGFGNNVRPAVFAEATSEAGLSSIPRYRNDIAVVGNDQTPLDRPAVATSSGPPMDVSPKPTGGNHHSARMYWRWRSAQNSPWECARFQRTVGESLPRAVMCPRAPAMVR